MPLTLVHPLSLPLKEGENASTLRPLTLALSPSGRGERSSPLLYPQRGEGKRIMKASSPEKN